MANYLIGLCLTRIALPLCILSSVLFRPSGLSVLYMLMFFILPFVPIPNTRHMRGQTGCYLRLVICISFLTAITQLTFQIVLFALPPYGYFLENCEVLERILRHVGFIRLDALSAKDIIQWLSPEIVMLFSSIGIYVLCQKLTVKHEIPTETEDAEEIRKIEKKKKRNYGVLIVIGRYLSLAALAVAGCLRPSIPNAFYFLIFLGAATWWSCYKQLQKAYAIVLRVTLVIIFLHLSVLYAYQFQWPQDLLEPNSTYARYFGLTPIISVNCDDPRTFIFNDLEWASYLNPVWLFFLYYMLALESKLLLMPPVISDTKAPSETTPLIRGISPSRNYGPGTSKSTILQDETGSVTVTGDGRDDIPMQTLGKGNTEEEPQSSVFENIIFALASIFQVIVRSSYIATNISMMAWSITYHSWLTFVLLLWANLLWLLPNQRRAMLRSAPFLVIYAEFLLLSAYVYGMNLTEEELPSKIKNINLAQIGFEKILILPCKPLLIKCLYTTMFWITLRQFMQERQEARQTSALADMVAPLQVTVGTATSVMSSTQDTKGNKMMKEFGFYLKKFLTKFWIWIVAINLFIVAITGDRMTGFRIIYMFLFLLFILTFQLSFSAWRKMMYVFWVTVIGYSMLTLVLVYTYQFDNFPDYWTQYLHIPPEQQLDIGLETYETKQLFVRLLTPTFFVVITVIQVHYFHKDFLEISNINARRSATKVTRQFSNVETNEDSNLTPQLSSIPREDEPTSLGSSAQGGPYEPDSERTDTETTTERPKVSFTTLKERRNLKLIAKRLWRKLQKAFRIFMTYLELHLIKVVLLVAMLLTVYDPCAIHFIIMLLAVAAFSLGYKAQNICIHFCSITVSIMLLARMIYQIKYIDHSKWDVDCDDNSTKIIGNSSLYNNAEWLGFRKVKDGRALPSLVKWYIGFIVVVMLRAVINISQMIWRIDNDKSPDRPFYVFPKITRTDADKNVEKCLMYLVDHGFYKFGVEVCFMATVALIGTRMDFYACLYGIWLCVMCMMSRDQLAKVWKWYLIFIAVVLPLQYFMVVGLPPGLCIVFPWDIEDEDERLRRMQDWMFLLDMKFPPNAHKLICDIFVLILVTRQSIVFRIEKRYENAENPYRGGSNKIIIELAEDPDFVNPVPDFVTYIRTWLDIFKRGIISSFMWLTLAIVFLAGTNRVNFFSLGYLIGSFFFLWQGSDLYLRPIPKIIKSWNLLIVYSVFVIMSKTLLQIWGCIFIDDVQACWLIRVLGVRCLKKFGESQLLTTPLQQTTSCTVSRRDIGLAWDGLCFGFLIMQRRIFNSFNFFHIVNEAKATTILASRGAELIEELREKQMSQKAEQEKKILEKIKLKMDKIKANQQKIQGPNYEKPVTHHAEDEDEEEEVAPIARSPSLSSCTSTGTSEHTAEAGYHTPIDDEDPPPLTPRTGSLLQTQAPSPCSALMTVSLEGYLEPNRMSFGSPPNSDLNPRPPSDDDSFPVFSPPPYETAVGEGRQVQRQNSIGPPWMQRAFVTPRQSVISYSSRSPQSHHTYILFPGSRPLKRRKIPTTYKEAIRSGDYYMFDDIDDEDLDLIHEKEDELVEDDLTKGNQITVSGFLTTALRRSYDYNEITGQFRRASMPLQRQRSTASQRTHLSAPLPLVPRSDKGPPRFPERKRIEPKPGSSKDVPDDEISLLTDIVPPGAESRSRQILNGLLFVWRFLESLMNTVTNFLNRFSRDYRYVLRVLSKEKRLLKEKTNFRAGVRRLSTNIWEPSDSFKSLIKKTSNESVDTTASIGSLTPTNSFQRTLDLGRSSNEQTDDLIETDPQPSSMDPIIPKERREIRYGDELDRRKTSVLTVPEIRILAPSMERGLDSHHESETETDIMDDYEAAEMSSLDQPAIVRLFHAIWFIILSHSDIVCYIMIFLNQIKSASVLSLPLPIMVFVWGTLTIPRPSKSFWITIIAYTEVIVLTKCIFQFNILDDNTTQENNPFYPPRIIGIERTSHYATYDLLLLLLVFFHRLMLKTLGLWKSSFETREIIRDGTYKIENDDDDKLKDNTLSLRKLSKEEADTLLDSQIKQFKQTWKDVTSEYGKKTRIINFDLPDGFIEEVKVSTAKFSLKNEKGKLKYIQEGDNAEPKDSTSLNASQGDENVIRITSKEVAPFKKMPATIKYAFFKYSESLKEFFNHLKDPTSRISADVYAYMFLCDFFNFMVVIFGFAAFGTQQGDGGVSAYLQENKVPIPFLLMLILQFVLIIVDRALFLRKYIMGKIIFQFLQIVGVHIWMFFVLPAITERQFNALLPPQMWYMVKCFYLLLSAYQIRCGYPTRILGNFLCKGYTYVNMFLFKGFMMIPFLFELRTIMDWMWTDTSMTIFDWLKMEDIFAHIFQLKCTRQAEIDFPQPRGKKKNTFIKYLMGGACLFGIIAVIWFPLVFFALGSTVGDPNIPYDVTVNVRIGPYQPIYSMSAQTNAIFRFTEKNYTTLYNIHKSNKVALTFLSSYDHNDIAAVQLNCNSTMIWTISPPDINRMLDEVESDNEIVLRLQYIISRVSNNKQESGIISSETEMKMPAKVGNKRNPVREELAKMLRGEEAVEPIKIENIFPKFVKVTNRAIATPVYQLLNAESDDLRNSLRNITMKLSRSKDQDKSEEKWWEVQEDCLDLNYVKTINRYPYANCKYLIMYTFNEKSFPASLSFFTGGGIIGLYTTLVFVASRMIRGFFSEICFKIMFDDMPYVDRILQLCLDIYLVREARELFLEEDLFAKLVFLFRSPETLIKWTRPKEEGGDPDDEEDVEGDVEEDGDNVQNAIAQN